MDFEYNQERRNKHWKHFMDGKEMPEGFSDSSYSNDTFPSIEHESNRVHIFFLDLDGWIGDIRNDTTDFTKYILESHESQEVYGYSFEDDDPKHKILATDSWDEVLEVIEEWNQRQRFIKLMDGVDLPDGFELDEKSLDLKVSAFPTIVSSTDDKDNPTIEILLYDYIGFKSLGWDDDILKETWEKIYPNEYKNNEFRIPRFQIQFSDYENLTDSWNEVLEAIEEWRKTQ